MIFISHKLDEVMNITNRVTVLRNGKSFGTVNTNDVNQNQLAAMMVGTEAFGVRRENESKSSNQKILELVDLSAVDDQGLPALKDTIA